MTTDPTSAIALSTDDRLAIHEFYARQAHAIDLGDPDGWARSFTRDGVFESPTYDLVARGPDELAEFARMSNKRASDRSEVFRHWTSAIAIDPLGADEVSVRSYLMILAVGNDGPRIDRSLTVDDVLVRQQGQWLMRSRRVTRDDAPVAD